MQIRTLPSVAFAMALALAPAVALASSHSEAPGTARDRLIDDTDLYAWVTDDAPDAVTIVGNWVPLLEPNGGPNFFGFDDDAAYYVNIDNVGDCLDHVRYQFKFKTTRQNGNTFLYNTGVVTSLDDPELNVRQSYTLTRYDNGVPTVLVSDAPVAPNFVGPVSMPDYASLAAAAVRTLGDGTRIFVGPRDDPFFVDLGAVFDLLTIRKVPGNKGKGVDGVSNYNVLTIALQIPKTRLTRDGAAPSAGANNHILGLYDSAERPATRTLNGDGTVSVSGAPIQVSRLGMPLVNEVVIPLKDKDRFNATKPTGDGVFASYVLSPEPAGLLTALYGIAVPPAPRNDIVAIFLTGIPGLNQPAGGTGCEMLRLNMAVAPASSPSRFGVLGGDVAGFPNGRRLSDDVVDIELRALAGATPFTPAFNIAPNNQLGDGIDVNDKPFLPYFPYVALPHDPLSVRGKNVQNGNSAKSAGLGAGDAGDPLTAGQVRSALSIVGANPASRPGLEYTVAQAARVTVKVFDVQGRVVRTLIDQDAAAGTFRTSWDGMTDDGQSAAKGMYFVRFTSGGAVADTRKVALE